MIHWQLEGRVHIVKKGAREGERKVRQRKCH